MSPELRFFLIIGIVLYHFFIIYFLRKKSLSLKYVLLWLLLGIVMFLLVIFPTLLSLLSNLVGIASPVNALFSVLLFFLMLILVSITSIVSKQNEKVMKLTQVIGLMEKRIRDLEK